MRTPNLRAVTAQTLTDASGRGTQSPPPPPQEQRQGTNLLAAGGMAIALAVGIIALNAASGDTAKAPAQPCTALAQERQSVERLIAERAWAAATAQAQAALSQTEISSCNERIPLIASWYTTATEEIFAAPVPPEVADLIASQLAVKWLAIQQQANRYQLPPDKRLSLTIASRACDKGLWALCDTVFKRALVNGELSANDIGVAHWRYAVLRNRGHHLAFSNPQTRDQGVLLLATAHAIVTAYGFPDGEACADLQKLGYADCNQAPADSADPVLAAARKGATDDPQS